MAAWKPQDSFNAIFRLDLAQELPLQAELPHLEVAWRRLVVPSLSSDTLAHRDWLQAGWSHRGQHQDSATVAQSATAEAICPALTVATLPFTTSTYIDHLPVLESI